MEEIDLLCRLCAQKKAKMTAIFADEDHKLDIFTKITQLWKINICPKDELPKNVCSECCEQLETSCEFYETCTRAQTTLQADVDRIKEAIKQERLESSKIVKDILKTRTTLKARRRKQLSVTIKRVSKRLAKEVSRKEEADLDWDDDNEARLSDEEWESSSAAKATRGSGRVRLDKYYTWQCTDCTKVLPSPQHLKEHHSKEHGQPVRYQCIECAKVYSVYRKFSRHVRLHRNHDKFKCGACGKTFSTKQSLDSHSIFHSTDRPHVCKDCGKTFRQRGSLYVHRRLHQADLKQFPCPECGKQLVSRQALDTHLKSHSGARDYTCELCGKSFTVKQGLVYHKLSHSGERPHPCQVCGMRCKTMYLLKKHLTTHSDVKKHQCDVCGKQFRERGTLLQHTRIHTGAMPYSCEFCAKSFRFQGALTIHRRQHTGERPYSCSECNRDFTNWANYNKHIKRRHGRTAKKNYADPDFYSAHPSKTTPLLLPATNHSTPFYSDKTKPLSESDLHLTNHSAPFQTVIQHADNALGSPTSDKTATNKLQPLVNDITNVEPDKLLAGPSSNDYNISPYLPTPNFVMNQCYLSM